MKYAVIGDGGWGTAVALLLVERGHDVVVWGHDADYVEQVKRRRENAKYLPDVDLPRDLEFTSDAEDALAGAGVVVNAVPTQFVRPVFEGMQPLVKPRTPILSLSKGIEIGTLERPSRILKSLFPKHPVAVLSGPSHAEEVARKMPASVVVAAASHPFARKLQNALTTPRFRVLRAG
jgi:glycerol-3-phosphate dehydrogenase (NAD(P)+)